MREQNPYDVLGVPHDASPPQIKAAYRRLARSVHPDVRGNDPEATSQFLQIKAAYELLSDPATRAANDTVMAMAAARELRHKGAETRRRRFDRPDLAGRQRMRAARRKRQRELTAQLSEWRQGWRTWEKSRKRCLSAAESLSKEPSVDAFWGLYANYRDCSAAGADVLASADAARRAWEQIDSANGDAPRVVRSRRQTDLARIQKSAVQVHHLDAQVGATVRVACNTVLREQIVALSQHGRKAARLVVALLRMRSAVHIGGALDRLARDRCRQLGIGLPKVVRGAVDGFDPGGDHGLLVADGGGAPAELLLEDVPGGRPPGQGARFSYLLQRAGSGLRARELFPE